MGKAQIGERNLYVTVVQPKVKACDDCISEKAMIDVIRKNKLHQREKEGK